MARNRGYSYGERIRAHEAGRTVLAHLTSTRPHSSAEVWRTRLIGGEVDLDGARAAPGDVVRPGQQLVWHRPPWDEPDVPLHFEVVHEDASIVAVVKPSGLPTMPAGGFLEHTLLTLVRRRYPDASPIHRLGRHTSGLVLFARTHTAAAGLGRAWRERDVEKCYRALGEGVASLDVLDIDAPIGCVPHPLIGSVFAAALGGKPSHSRAIVLERRADSTLFDVRITTGRPHQIRIHLAHAGHPLVGDPLYAVGGVPRDHEPGLPGDGGYLLHAERLRFVHPITAAVMDLRAPPPPELCY